MKELQVSGSKTDSNEDDVLKRLLNTPHKKRKPTTELGRRRREAREKAKD